VGRTGAWGPCAGFTLLELLIAMTLTGLLSLVAYTALSLSFKAMGHGGAAMEQVQELRVGETILHRSLGSAARGTVHHPLYFVGNAGELQFVTPVPLEAYNLGGLYHWRLLAGEDESGQRVLAVEQTKNVNWLRDPKGVEDREILLGGLTSLRLAYGRGGEEVAAWDAKTAGALPDWVRIYLTPKGREPLVLFIPILVSEYGSGIKAQ
jgi:general secretion pathway protein J